MRVNDMTTGRLLKLHRHINSVFLMRRDAGYSVASIYSQLKTVERRLSDLGIFWAPDKRRE